MIFHFTLYQMQVLRYERFHIQCRLALESQMKLRACDLIVKQILKSFLQKFLFFHRNQHIVHIEKLNRLAGILYVQTCQNALKVMNHRKVLHHL